jgi:hypothetical protein
MDEKIRSAESSTKVAEAVVFTGTIVATALTMLSLEPQGSRWTGVPPVLYAIATIIASVLTAAIAVRLFRVICRWFSSRLP